MHRNVSLNVPGTGRDCPCGTMCYRGTADETVSVILAMWGRECNCIGSASDSFSLTVMVTRAAAQSDYRVERREERARDVPPHA